MPPTVAAESSAREGRRGRILIGGVVLRGRSLLPVVFVDFRIQFFADSIRHNAW
jgi:hypothetical protein